MFVSFFATVVVWWFRFVTVLVGCVNCHRWNSIGWIVRTIRSHYDWFTINNHSNLFVLMLRPSIAICTQRKKKREISLMKILIKCYIYHFSYEMLWLVTGSIDMSDMITASGDVFRTSSAILRMITDGSV